MPALAAPGLLILLIAFVGMASVALSRNTSNAFLSFLQGVVRGALFLAGPLAELAVGLARYIARDLSAYVFNAVVIAVHWFAALIDTLEHVFTSALAWPVELFRLQEWLVTHEIPRLVRALAGGATTVVTVSAKRLAAIEREIVTAERYVLGRIRPLALAAATAAVAPVLPLLHWLRAHVAALAHAIPRTLDLPTPRDWTNLRKRIGKLERLVGAGVAIGAVAAALARLGLGWLRCRKVGRVGRQVCGMDDSLLESLLGDAVAIFSLLSVVEFARELRTVEDEALAIMGRLVREFPAA